MSAPTQFEDTSPPFQIDKNKESSENNLDGHRARTPIISAIVSSAAVIAIWAFIFSAWLWKQYKKRIRARRRAAKGLPPKVKKPKQPPPTFILPPDPAVLTGQRKPGERAIPQKHHSLDKDKDNGRSSAEIELNERSRPISECGAHNEMLARQIFSKHSPLDPPKHEKRHNRHASKSSTMD